MKCLAVIAARGGSKGLPGKNIADCAGKPLIAWTIQAALDARGIDQVLVSTDSKEIAEIARSFGAEVPWLRPAAISGDEAGIEAVMRHALDNCENKFDLLCSLQPTSPLRTAAHLEQALSFYKKHSPELSATLVSVVLADSKNRWLLEKDEQGFVSMPLLKNRQGLRRQDLPECYFPNGAIYLAPAADFTGFYGPKTLPFLMDARSSIDVDHAEDLALASRALEAISK